MSSNSSYILLDSGHGRKLEQVGPVRIERQSSLALWEPKLSKEEWKKAHAVHVRSDKGGGHWDLKNKFSEKWITQVGPFQLHTKLTSFGHLGFFVEQLDEWNWFLKTIPLLKQKLDRAPRILNLFGYTGCSSLALAQGGAEVTHVDAAKGIVDWGRENQQLNTQTPSDSIRWIIDDCLTFVEREARRGNKYDGVVLDPPSYGRGPNKQLFKIEDNILPLIEAIAAILEPKVSLVHFSCHTPGFTPRILENFMKSCVDLEGMILSNNEMLIHSQENSQFSLPSGVCFKGVRL